MKCGTPICHPSLADWDVAPPSVAFVNGPVAWTVCDVCARFWDTDAVRSVFGALTASEPMGITIPLSSFDPGVTDPARWNTALDHAKARAQQTPFQLLIDGQYSLAHKFTIDTPMCIRGIGIGYSTLTFTTGGDAGIEVTTSAAYTTLDEFSIYGPDALNGPADVGLNLRAARCKASRLHINSWGGVGLRFEGIVQQGTNANEGSFRELLVSMCGNSANQTTESAGVYCIGGDANACLFYACHVVDSRRGFYDQSFLGNAYVACSVEACNDRFINPNNVTGYGFVTTNPNARSTFVGCYAELDSESDIRLPATVIGGFIAANRGNAPRQTGAAQIPYLTAYNPYASDKATSTVIGGSQAGLPAESALTFAVTNPTTGQVVHAPHSLCWSRAGGVADWWSLNYAGLIDKDPFRFRAGQLWVPGDLQRGNPRASMGMREHVAASTSAADNTGPSDGGTWNVGDRLIISAPSPGQPSTYRVTAVAQNGLATWTVESRLDP